MNTVPIKPESHPSATDHLGQGVPPMRLGTLVSLNNDVHVQLHDGAPLDGLAAILTAFATRAKSEGVPTRRLIIDLKQALTEVPALRSLEPLARSDTMAWLIHGAIDAYYGEQTDPLVDAPWLRETPAPDGQHGAPETISDEKSLAHICAIVASSDFVAFCDQFRTFIRHGTQESCVRTAAGRLARVARGKGWTPVELIRSLHTTECYPGPPFQSTVVAISRRYGRGLDIILHAFFRDE
ncbi:MAG: hypothetical protein ABI969_04335 [bacterium]